MHVDDTAAVSSLHSQLDISHWNQNQWLEALNHYPCAWVLDASGGVKESPEIAGYVIYQTRVPQVELLNIGIASNYQGKGLATELLLTSMKLLPEDTESIFLEVRRSNIPAIGLYEKVGYKKVGQRRDYYSVAGGTKEDALIYKYECLGDL